MLLLQAKELLDHLEHTFSNQPVDVVGWASAVEVKASGCSKGQTVEKILNDLTSPSKAPAPPNGCASHWQEDFAAGCVAFDFLFLTW